jgi:hypothetical protein
MYVLLRPSG